MVGLADACGVIVYPGMWRILYERIDAVGALAMGGTCCGHSFAPPLAGRAGESTVAEHIIERGRGPGCPQVAAGRVGIRWAGPEPTTEKKAKAVGRCGPEV